jgi:hypothetical protein
VKILSKSVLMLTCFFFIFSSVVSAAPADAPLRFEPGDTIEDIQKKIQHNGYSFTVEANPIFDMAPDEKGRFFSRRAPMASKALRRAMAAGPLEDMGHLSLPEAFDWRNVDERAYIGPIRDQDACGSCYAFGAGAAAEGTYNFVTSQFNDAASDFSEAFIAFCLSDHYTGFDGCDGSDYDYEELDGLVDFGIADEDVAPYAIDTTECPFDPYPGLTRFKSWHRIGCGDIDAIKRAIVAFGVLDVAVYVTDAFQAYSSGVYEDQNTACDDDPDGICYYASTNHAVSLVGWDDNPPEGGGGCWILRNSWGDDWGENGYMRIRYDSAHVACEATYLVYEGDGPAINVSSATDISGIEATVNAMIDPGGMDTDVHVEYGTTVECLTKTAVIEVSAGDAFKNVDVPVADLTPQTTYHYRVVASSDRGTAYSTLNHFTTTGISGRPDARTGGAVVSLDQTAVSGWINPHGAATTWYVEYGPDTGYGASTEALDASDGTQDLSVSTVLTALLPSTTYHYRVVAENEAGTTLGQDHTFVSGKGANAPLAVTLPAGPVGSGLAVLQGMVNPNNSETSVPAYYWFEYGTTAAYGSTTPERYAGPGLEELEISETIADLAPLTTYHFRMVAENSAGTTYGADLIFTTVQTLVQETFDHAGQAPPGWTQEIVSGTTQWVYQAYGTWDNPNYYAYFNPATDESETRLVTPKIDLTGVAAPVLSVDCYIGYSGNIQVYYRENPDDPWQTDASLDLSSNPYEGVMALPTGLDRIYLAFSGTSDTGGDSLSLYSVTVLADAGASGGPILDTGDISDVSATTALCTATVISDNSAPIVARGVCWSPLAIPTLTDGHTVESGQVGAFSSRITGLSANTLYYVRAYATNGAGTAYGDAKTIQTTDLSPPTVLAATSVTANQFTANWQPVAGAEGYYIDVWESGTPLATHSREKTLSAGSPVTSTAPGMTTVAFSFDSGDVAFAEDSGFTAVYLKDGVRPQDTPGTPWLPAQYINLMIPAGASVTGIEVSGDEEILKTGVLVYPVQPFQSPSLPARGFVDPDPAAYAATDKTPVALAVLQGAATMRGQSIVSLRINPVRYVPADRALFLSTRLSVTVHYEENRSQGLLPADPLFQDALNSLVVNPGAAPDLSVRMATGGVDYLVITRQDLAEAFGQLTAFRQDTGGLNCEIKTVEEIETQYVGRDRAEKIRNCIIDYVAQKGLVYVVLGGDDTVVPVRNCPVRYYYYEADMPTDLYYSGLDGDWDGNLNRVYGEAGDQVDLAPDVIVGRIPVRTAAQVKAYADKLIAFETDPQVLSRSTMLLTGSKKHDVYYGDDRPTDLMADGHLEFRDPNHPFVCDAEMWVRRLYRDHISPLYQPDTLGFLFDTLTSWDSTRAGDYDLSPGTVKAIYNQGWTHLFSDTHGGVQAWGLEGYAAIYSSDIAAMTGLTPFVYTTACLSNYFSNAADPCLSEAFIRNPNGGALTYVGSSHYGWFSPDYPASDSSLSSCGDSLNYAMRYYARLFETDFISSGEAFALHKADLMALCSSDTTARWIQFGLNLMGDPAIMMGGRYVPGYYHLYVGDATQVDITGLTSASNYHYRVSAVGGGSSLRDNSATADVQTAGMDMVLGRNDVPENRTIGTVVGPFSTPDPAGTHTFELVAGTGDADNGFFAIDDAVLKTGAVFDFETRDQYNIRVRANDGTTGSFEKAFIVTVTNVDDDTDDDGIPDSREDPDGDGVVDPGETDPHLADSDGDGVQDGTETGLTGADIGPETDTAVFVPDSDPTTTTSPLTADTDGDGWTDGEEDADCNGQVDDGETSPNDYALPTATPPEVIQTIPHDNAGIGDDTRVPDNTCFAAYVTDADGIDITDGQSIVLTINDGRAPAYERDLGDTNVVRVVRLTDDPDTMVKELWVVYDRSGETSLDPTYAFGATVNVTVAATDRRGGSMDQDVFSFSVETEQAHIDAAAAGPGVDALARDDPALGGDYDAGVKARGPELAGAMIVYDSTGPVTPGFGPSGEIPPIDIKGVTGVGVPMNLEPPAVFNVPVKLFIPCGDMDVSTLSVFLYDGQNWVLACDTAGDVAPGGHGFIVPGSRVDHNNQELSAIEIKVYHFSAVQAATVDNRASSGNNSPGGCFISILK